MVGVADASEESAVAGAGLVGSRPYASYGELVAVEDVEVVNICLPTAFHKDLALKAAREGRHVILEKPIARTIEDAREILDAFSGEGPRLFVGHGVRFFPEYVAIKDKTDAGELGTIGVVRTSRRSPFLTGWNDWYADWRVSGGVLVDLLIHDSDFLRWAIGDVERVYTCGVLGREYNRRDYALVTLRFESGAIAHVEGHWGCPGPFNYSIEVAGSRALLSADSTEPATLELICAQHEARDLASGTSPYETELAHFVRCIATGEGRSSSRATPTRRSGSAWPQRNLS